MMRHIVRSVLVGLLAFIFAAGPAAGIVFADQRAESVTPLEREFLTVIRYANLWEIPMGQLATRRGTTQTVRAAGATIAADHTKLNTAIEKLGAQFGVTLPDAPTSSQQSWIAEISGKTGTEFDAAFANRLRAAHGTVFGLVAEVRAETRNDTIRGFAQQANEIVMKHMTLLEGTGRVSATGVFAEASARTLAYPENRLGRTAIVLAVVLGLLALAATLVAVRTLSSGAPTEVRAIRKG
jgi:putative membrane protein